MSTDLDTAPSHGENHPSELAWTAINNAAQIAEGLKTPGDDGGSVEDDSVRIVELLTEAGMHVADLVSLLKRQERTIEEQRVECLQAKQAAACERGLAAREKTYATRVEETNSALNEALIAANNRIAVASKALEQLLITASIDTQRASVVFTDIQKTREALDPTIAQATTRITAPRLAAGA